MALRADRERVDGGLSGSAAQVSNALPYPTAHPTRPYPHPPPPFTWQSSQSLAPCHPPITHTHTKKTATHLAIIMAICWSRSRAIASRASLRT